MSSNYPTIKSSLDEWLSYWSQIHVTGIDLGLERVQPIAEYLQLTQPTAKVFTVAGTNGKGSTTTTIASILTAQGYRVGLYQSPHIYRFNERVKLSGQEVTDQQLISAFVEVEHARQACKLSLSFFEATTLAALFIFKQQQCDVWVLEVGLGGRLDVVNVIDADVAVITNIGLDHVEWLGTTIEQIAYEKAGIIRPHIPVVFAGDQPVPEAILKKIEDSQARLVVYKQDYYIQSDLNGWVFASEGMTIHLPKGKLAIENMAAAISAVLLSGLNLTSTAIIQGIKQAKLAGRYDIRTIQEKTIIFDAGHNPHGIDFLIKQIDNDLKHNISCNKMIVVFSMLMDKDIQTVVNCLIPYVSEWYIAPLNVTRAAPLETLQHCLDGQQVHCFDSVAHAFTAALDRLHPHQLMLVCGSFHTLEAVWEILDHEQ